MILFDHLVSAHQPERQEVARTITRFGSCDHQEVTADLVPTLVTALFAGGGLWLTVREIAKQVGETRRERIRRDAEVACLAMKLTLPEHSASAAEPGGHVPAAG